MNLRLLQLVSPVLPVGGYSYSQGLESAVEAGWVHDAMSAESWIGDVLALTLATMEAPILLRLIRAWRASDACAVQRWNDEFLAARETCELRAETLQMGYSLRLLLRELSTEDCASLDAVEEIAFPAAFAFAAATWAIEASDAAEAYLFGWAENQVLAAIKCVPLGQTDGQRVLLALGERICALVEKAATLRDDECTNFAPGFALASVRHETQYSRIFRS